MKRGGKGKKGKQSGPSRIAKLAAQARIDAEEEEKQRLEEELLAKQKAEEEEQKRLEEERKAKEAADLIRAERRKEREEAKKAGTYMTPAQEKAERMNQLKLKQMAESGLLSSTHEPKATGLPTRHKKKNNPPPPPTEVQPEQHVHKEEEVKAEEVPEVGEPDNWEDLLEEESAEEGAGEAKSESASDDDPQNEDFSEFNAPVICILGHVDTGKTKLLDKIRRTNVQVGEAGGITQQIGATMFPAEAIKLLVDRLPNLNIEVKLPGVLIIDTPGHESFSNLRSRGSSLCNLGILVVDIMHGLEKQTLESLGMLTKRNIPFVVALNKIDQLYGWKPCKDEAFFTSFNQQNEDTQSYFRDRSTKVCLEFAEKGLNAALYYENPDPREYISLIPTSAITGEGLPDLLGQLMNVAQETLLETLRFKEELQATVMEVKVIEGLGTTVDVILANGRLREGQTIVLGGLNGPIVTHIRALLTPHPLKEMRVKGDYIHHKQLRAATGIKITGANLEAAMAGSPLFVAHSPDEIPQLEEEVNQDFSGIFKYISKTGQGVHVQASTIGSLEALLEFLRTSKIPVSGVNIGTVFKKDVLKALTQLEKAGNKEHAAILAFDVKINHEARDYAESMGVKIFSADIIYHLFDMYTKHLEDIRAEYKQSEGKGKEAVFPAVLKILDVFRTRDPIILGVNVAGGVLKVGTPLCVPQRGNLIIGKVDSMQANKVDLQSAKKGQDVAVKIAPMNSEQSHYTVGRHFEAGDQVASWITRNSIDSLKEYFMDEMTMDDWKIVKALKTQYGII